MELVVRNREELAEAIQSIAGAISDALSNLRQENAKVHIEHPKDLKITGVLLLDYDDGVDTVTDSSPQTTTTTTENVPQIVATDVTTAPQTTTTTTENVPQIVATDVTAAPQTTTTTTENVPQIVATDVTATPGQTTSETSTPPARRENRERSGGNKIVTDREWITEDSI